MSARIPILAAFVLAAALLTACRLERDRYAGALAPPPDSVRDAAAKGEFAGVAAYARTLSYDTLRGSGDRQRLMLGRRCAPWSKDSDCRYGPLVTIQPQSDAHRIPDTLDLGRGRVVARIVTADSGYAKLNVSPNDTTYWWMDRGGENGRWRAVLVSSNPDRRPVIKPNALWHPAQRGNPNFRAWHQAIARFLWTDTDEGLWVTCIIWGCCSLDAPPDM